MGRNERMSEKYTHFLAQNDGSVGPPMGTSVERRTVGCLTGPALRRAEPRRGVLMAMVVVALVG